MNKQQIRTKYQEYVEPLIEVAEQWEDNKYFDKMFDIYNSKDGYHLLFPLCLGYGDFADFCELFSHIDYSIRDDGCISLVHYTLQRKMEVLDKEYIVNSNDYFCMNGFPSELSHKKIYKYATTHSSEPPWGTQTSILTNYACYLFDWETIDFLHSLIPMIPTCDWKNESNFESYHAQCLKYQNKIKEYIISQKNHVSENLHYPVSQP